jgi:hypothetical protein
MRVVFRSPEVKPINDERIAILHLFSLMLRYFEFLRSRKNSYSVDYRLFSDHRSITFMRSNDIALFVYISNSLCIGSSLDRLEAFTNLARRKRASFDTFRVDLCNNLR